MVETRDTCALPQPEEHFRGPPAVGYGEYDEAGVDLSLLRWFLQLTPVERLTLMEQHARDTQALSEYGRRHREAQAAAHR
jgi:hypothetical protein